MKKHAQSEAVEVFGFGCGGDDTEVLARVTNTAMKSWTALDGQADNEARAIAFMGRVRFATVATCPTPETALSDE